jgi:malonyl CoA-acyl carrier protein transacylase
VLELARRLGCTPFMVVHAALVIVLSARGAGEDVLIGTPASARTDGALEELIGFFVNTIVLRVRCTGDPTVEELLSRVRAADLAAFAHQDLPFDELVRALNVPRRGGWQPLFTVMLAYQNFEPARLNLIGTQADAVLLPSDVARFDVRFELTEQFADDGSPKGIGVTLTWSLDVAGEELADALLADLIDTLGTLAARPTSRISGLHDGFGSEGEEAAAPLARRSRSGGGGIAFVFSPFGQQWVGMARTMLSEEPVFRATLEEIDHELSQHAQWRLIAELLRDEPESRLSDVSVMQPAVFAIQVGLCRWLESQGVRPAAVIGHSLGEISACVAAGMLDVADASRLVIVYSAEQQRIAGRGGGMLVAELSLREMEACLARHDGAVDIASTNGPGTTVVAGPTEDLNSILLELRSQDVLCAMIRVDLPAHTAAIDEILPDLIRRTRGITGRHGRVPMISTVTVAQLDWREIGPEYFAANLRRPVRLAESSLMLLRDWGMDALVEISANPILEPALRQSVEHAGTGASVFTTMRRSDRDDRAGVQRAARALTTSDG